MAPTELVVESEEDLELSLSMKRQVTEEEEEDEMPLSARKRARSALQSETSNLLPDEVFIVSIPRSLSTLVSSYLLLSKHK